MKNTRSHDITPPGELTGRAKMLTEVGITPVWDVCCKEWKTHEHDESCSISYPLMAHVPIETWAFPLPCLTTEAIDNYHPRFHGNSANFDASFCLFLLGMLLFPVFSVMVAGSKASLDHFGCWSLMLNHF